MPKRPDLDELATEMAGHARDAAYVVVGLGVLGLQKAQVQRQELAKRAGDADEQVERLRRAVSAGVEQLAQWFDATIAFAESSVGPLESQLPAPVREAADKAKAGVQECRRQLRQLVSPGRDA